MECPIKFIFQDQVECPTKGETQVHKREHIENFIHIQKRNKIHKNGHKKLYKKSLEELGIVSYTNSLDSFHREYPYVE